MVDLAAPTAGTVVGACPHDCPDGCGWEVEVRGGVAVSLRGQRDHPFTRGALCAKVDPYLAERVYHPDRLLHPLLRTGPKGEGTFRRATWNEALDVIAAGLADRIAAHGPETVLGHSYAGSIGPIQNGSMDRRVLALLGASLLDRTICATAGEWAHHDTVGGQVGPDPEDLDRADLVLVWGTNPMSTNLHAMRALRGRRVVVIDAFRTRTARRAGQFVQIRPGTDTALALALARHVIDAGAADTAFLCAHTTGFDAFAAAAEEWTPDRAAATTGIPAATITALGDEIAAARVLCVKTGYGLTRHANGATTIRALAGLATLTGAWRHRGGGLLLSTSGHHHRDTAALQRPGLLPTPAPRTINMSTIGAALTGDLDGPPITGLIVYCSNLAATSPDQSAVLDGLLRDDLLTVVHEHFLTDTARYADVVLPATTQLEHLDVMGAYGHRHLQLNRPAIAPRGEAVPVTELFRRIGRALGLDHPCLDDTDADLCEQAIDWARAGTSLDELATGRPARSPDAASPCADGFPHRDGRFHFAGARGDDPPRLVALPDDGHPWRLLSPSGHRMISTTFANADSARRAEGPPAVTLHPDDAAARGLGNGDRARVVNGRGAFDAVVAVSDDAAPGTAWTASVRWLSDHAAARNVNVVVGPGLTDRGGQATFYDAQVDVVPA